MREYLNIEIYGGNLSRRADLSNYYVTCSFNF